MQDEDDFSRRGRSGELKGRPSYNCQLGTKQVYGEISSMVRPHYAKVTSNVNLSKACAARFADSGAWSEQMHLNNISYVEGPDVLVGHHMALVVTVG